MIEKITQVLKEANLYSEEGPERCGFILPDLSIIEVDNKSPQPIDGFLISVDDVMSYVEEKMAIATWHTHPNSKSLLSSEDYIFMTNWPDLIHAIVGSDGVSLYQHSEKSGAILCL